MTPKYYKSKTSNLLIQFIEDMPNKKFKGITIVTDEFYKPVGSIEDDWYKPNFELCEIVTLPLANENAQAEPQPSNDIEVRLKCLELALEFNKGEKHNIEYITADAEYLLAWVTKTTNP